MSLLFNTQYLKISVENRERSEKDIIFFSYFIIRIAFKTLQALHQCSPRGLPEEDSVVSVYTTQSTTDGVTHVDVYHQIANNIAERITSPIYR